MKRALFYIGLMWKPVFFTLLIIGIASFVLGYKLDTLAPGYSSQELAQRDFVSKLSNIANNPVNAPLNLVQYSFIKIGNNGLVWLRVVSCLFALISSIIFYSLIRKWQTNRVALLTTAMLLSSSWILMTARTGVPNIILTFLGLAVVTYFWLRETNKKKLALFVSAVGISVLVYIPGGIFIVVGGLIWKGKDILKEARKVPFLFFATCLLVSLVLLLPLIWASYNDHTVAFNAVGLYGQSFSASAYLSSLWSNFLGLFVNSSRIGGANVGKTGIIDVFSITLLLAGIIVTIKKYGQDKMKYLLFGLLGSFLLSGVNQLITITIVLPIIYLLIGTGLAWLLHQWLAVFPRNPIAKNIGVVIAIVGVSFSVYFNTYRYFVAWPHMSETKAIYNQKP